MSDSNMTAGPAYVISLSQQTAKQIDLKIVIDRLVVYSYQTRCPVNPLIAGI